MHRAVALGRSSRQGRPDGSHREPSRATRGLYEHVTAGPSRIDRNEHARTASSCAAFVNRRRDEARNRRRRGETERVACSGAEGGPQTCEEAAGLAGRESSDARRAGKGGATENTRSPACRHRSGAGESEPASGVEAGARFDGRSIDHRSCRDVSAANDRATRGPRSYRRRTGVLALR